MTPRLARLDVVAGKAAGMSIVVDDELLIGRHADGAGRLAEDDEISRSHARLTLDSAGFCAIEDLASTNGTFVNGLRISSPQTLTEGDSIEMGGTTLVVRELPVPASEQTRRPAPPQRTLTQGDSRTPAEPGLEPVPAALEIVREPEEDGEEDQTRVTRRATLSLQLEADLAAGEATITLGGNSQPLKLVFEKGAWRYAVPPN
jgi:pSer/pThr/pTyr-binding forkhead associated (FHA) protein